MEPPGQKPLVVNGLVVGPFEEEEEGTGITSDVKLQGKFLPPQIVWGLSTRGTTTGSVPQMSGQQNKATHTQDNTLVARR